MPNFSAYAAPIGQFLVSFILIILPQAVLAGDQIFQDGFEDNAPRIISTPVTEAQAEESYSYDVDAIDPNGETLTYSLTVSPQGMSINSESGLIQWTPPTIGDFAAEVEVSNESMLTSSQAWMISVAPAPDTDGDGLSDTNEALYGTDPDDPDSDDDGLLDGEEVFTYGTNPLLIDSDRDGLTDGDEVDLHATNPILVDTDGDFFGDGVEISVGTNPLDPGDFPAGPVDPTAVATEIDPTVVTTLYDSTTFIWNGTPPIQTGVAPDTIDPQRAAVISGVVVDSAGTPLPGVIVTIKDHPEFGQTISRVDGAYDMVINGGFTATLNYEKAGFLPAQRQVAVPWHEYVSAPTLAMIPLDINVTEFDLNAGTMTVAQGSLIDDADGMRRATLMSRPGTTAELVFPDGSTQSISMINVRATEYTIGPMGPQMMPGVLPPTSGYTYAVELSADEALAAGAKDVVFSQPLPFYIENFLGFPVGSAVPAGYYDSSLAAWVASDNGLVIEIISETDGKADLDLDGDGMPNTGQDLIDLNITDEERENLANLYAPGQTLWRIPIAHFTPWDYNWPYTPPGDAIAPETSARNNNTESEDFGCGEVSGSIIGCQNQVLSEEIPLAGTSLALNYNSNRTAGRKDLGPISISLSGDSVPASLEAIELNFSIAGQQFTQSFPAMPNQSTSFIWDGHDAFGRRLQGGAVMLGTVSYVYPAEYVEPGDFAASFGRFSDTGATLTGSRDSISIEQPFDVPIRNFQALGVGLGGWTLNSHHVYDTTTGVLYRGDGVQRAADSINPHQDPLRGAGGGPPVQQPPDIVIALEYPIGAPSQGDDRVAVGQDGTVYIGEHRGGPTLSRNRIWALQGDGTMVRVAGNDCGATEGQPQNVPSLDYCVMPRGIAVGPSGDLYVSNNGCWIARITPGGLARRIAGSSCGALTGIDGSALDAQFIAAKGLVVGQDGTVYFVEANERKILAILPSGKLVHIAGNGDPGFSGEDILATQAGMEPIHITLSGGRMVFTGNCRVRGINGQGKVRTISGGNGCGSPTGDGGSAKLARMYNPQGIDVQRDGSIVVSDDGGRRIRRIQNGRITTIVTDLNVGSPFFPDTLATSPDGTIYFWERDSQMIRAFQTVNRSLLPGQTAIASRDGSELYLFDGNGRHQQTLNTFTNAPIYTFDYDGNGLLSQVTDGDANVTTIQRDGEGHPTAIVSPFGQQTSLGVDARGYINSITNPANEQMQFTSNVDGLIVASTDPRGLESQYEFDELGLLIGQSNSAGRSQSLLRSESTGGHQVDRTTSLGHSVTYQVENTFASVEEQIVTAPDGSHQTGSYDKATGAASAVSATGMSTTSTMGADPRFGMQAPFVATASEDVPSGPTLNISGSRVAVLTDPYDILSLETQITTLSIDGLTSTSSYDAPSNTEVVTTPEGRTVTYTYDLQGRITNSQIADLAPVAASYNALGQLESIDVGTGTDTRTTTFTYGADGYLQNLTDALGRTSSYTRDLAGRVTLKTLPGPVSAAFSYDEAGEMDTITPPGQPEHGFTRTLNGQIESVTPPAASGSGTSTFSYNEALQLTEVSRPGGELLEVTHDIEGRVQTISLSENAVPTADYSYTYLTADQLDTITGPGSQTLSYGYQGDFVTGESWGGPIQGSVSWTYDNAFRLSSESVNGGAVIAYAYDDDDLLTDAGDFTIVRDAINGFAQSTSIGVIQDSWTYNTFGEPETYSALANAVPIYEVSYTRNKVGQITQKVETIGGMTDTYDFGYDDRDQLTEVQKNSIVIESYVYDDNGNRLSATVNTVVSNGTYDAQDRLINYGGNSYSYSGSGRLSTRTEPGNLVTEYDYNVVGSLQNVTLPNLTEVTYDLDGQDRRIQRSVDAVVSYRLLYDGILPMAKLDDMGNVSEQYIYAGSHVPEYMIKNGNTYRFIADQVGSVRLVVDVNDGATVQRLDYDSFGNVLLDTNPGFQPFGFSGGVYDPDTGLLRFGARDYDPETGRWTAKDPSGFAGGDSNLYRYVNNNPINFVDINGTSLTDMALGALNAYLGRLETAMIDVMRINPGINGMMSLYDVFDSILEFDEPHLADLLPKPGNMEDYNAGEFGATCTFIAIESAIGLGAGAVGIPASKIRTAKILENESKFLRNQREAAQLASRKEGRQIYSKGKASLEAAAKRNGGKAYKPQPEKISSEAMPSTPSNGPTFGGV